MVDAEKKLKVVDRREAAHVLVVHDAAQPGGRNQVVAYVRGCVVTTPEYACRRLALLSNGRPRCLCPDWCTCPMLSVRRTRTWST